MTNSNVDAVEGLDLVLSIMGTLLVEDGVNSNSGFAGLTITNDQLTLTTTNWDEGVDGLETSLHWFVD